MSAAEHAPGAGAGAFHSGDETAYKSACGTNTQSLDAMCGKIMDAINVVCGSGPGDGGSAEGGADSGTD
jgi:hypothetical protein